MNAGEFVSGLRGLAALSNQPLMGSLALALFPLQLPFGIGKLFL